RHAAIHRHVGLRPATLARIRRVGRFYLARSVARPRSHSPGGTSVTPAAPRCAGRRAALPPASDPGTTAIGSPAPPRSRANGAPLPPHAVGPAPAGPPLPG